MVLVELLSILTQASMMLRSNWSSPTHFTNRSRSSSSSQSAWWCSPDAATAFLTISHSVRAEATAKVEIARSFILNVSVLIQSVGNSPIYIEISYLKGIFSISWINMFDVN